MSYEGSVLRGEKFAVMYTEDQMKKEGGCIYADYQIFLESEAKMKAKVKPEVKAEVKGKK